MYGNPPVFLHPVSNREDLLLTISIWDDDTGDPINLSATVTASGMSFTAFGWEVITGPSSTFYPGQLTVPAPPIGNELSALTIPLGAGLGNFIKPGQPVKIADDATGLNYMLGIITSYDNVNGTLVCQIGNSFQFEIRSEAPRNASGYGSYGGYTPYYGAGTINETNPLIKAALGTGLTIVDLGVIQILILESTMRRLHLTTYGAYMTMFDGTNTRQVLIANLPVLYGGVTI